MRFCAEATGCSARVTCSSKARATAPACPARLTETSSAPPTPGFAFRRAGDRSPVTSAVDAHLRAGGSHISTSRSNIAAIRLCGFLSRAVGLLGHEKTIGLESIVFGPQPSHRHRPMLCCPHAPIGRTGGTLTATRSHPRAGRRHERSAALVRTARPGKPGGRAAPRASVPASREAPRAPADMDQWMAAQSVFLPRSGCTVFVDAWGRRVGRWNARRKI